MNVPIATGGVFGSLVRDVAPSGGVGPTGEFRVQNIPAGKYRVYVSPVLVPIAAPADAPRIPGAPPPPPPVPPALQNA